MECEIAKPIECAPIILLVGMTLIQDLGTFLRDAAHMFYLNSR